MQTVPLLEDVAKQHPRLPVSPGDAISTRTTLAWKVIELLRGVSFRRARTGPRRSLGERDEGIQLGYAVVNGLGEGVGDA
jgi:hypothetical protein